MRIECKTQAELDAVLEAGDYPELRGDGVFRVDGNATVYASGNVTVVACDEVTVWACDEVTVLPYGSHTGTITRET